MLFITILSSIPIWARRVVNIVKAIILLYVKLLTANFQLRNQQNV